MAGEHIDKCNVPEKEIKFGSGDTHTMRRSRSLNELPGHHRVTILKRHDTERTQARLEAVAAGMEELKHLRKQHQQRMEETLCESFKKQDHTTELAHRHRPNERQHNCMPFCYQERNHRYARDYFQNSVAHERSKHQKSNPQHDLEPKGNSSLIPVESSRQNRIDKQNNARQYNANSDVVTPQTNRPKEIKLQKVSCDLDHRQRKHQDAPMEYARTQNDDQLRSSKQQNDYRHSAVYAQSEPKERVSNNQTVPRTSEQDYFNSQNNNRCQNVTFQDCSKVSNDSRQRSANTSDYSQQRSLNGQYKLFYSATSPISHAKERYSTLKSVNQIKEHTSNAPIIQTPTNFSSTSTWSEEGRRATSYRSSSHQNTSPNLNGQIKTPVSLSPQTKYASNKVCEDNNCGDNTCGDNNCGGKFKEPDTFHKAQNLDGSGSSVHCHMMLSVNESDPPGHQNKMARIQQMTHCENNSVSIARHNDYDHKLSQFLMQQSNQRFSRGRTQSVHENFYYFPTRKDNGNMSTNQKDDSKLIKRASPQQFNTDHLNGRSLQNNCSNSDYLLSVPYEAKKISKLGEQRFQNTSSSHKSFSWEELLVAVGLSKKETQNNCENSRESIFSDTTHLDECQSKLTTSAGTNTNTAGDVKKNDDESRTSYKVGLAKPHRSQSFSIQVEPSRNLQYPDEVHSPSNPIFNLIGISRHPSLSQISSKILNPLHEVDLRSMNQPGPVHAVTLQYAGLTTRHMSLGTIPSISHTNYRNEELRSTKLKSDLTGKAPLELETFKLKKDSTVSKVSHPEPRHSFNPQDRRLSGNRSRDVDLKTQSLHDLQTSLCLMDTKPNTMLSLACDDANLPTSVAQTRSHNSTSTFSPKMSPIKTIVEDCEDVFENCLELMTPVIKPRSLSDTVDKSDYINQHTVSSTLKTSAHLSDLRKETTKMKIVTVTDASMSTVVPTESDSSSSDDVESMYSDYRPSSSNPATVTLNAGVVVVVEDSYTASKETKADTKSRDNSVSNGTLKYDSAYSNNWSKELEQGYMQSQRELTKRKTDPRLFSTLDRNTDTSCATEHILVNSIVFQQTPSELLQPVSCCELAPTNMQSFNDIITSRSTEGIDDATAIMNEQTRNPINDQTDKESLALKKTKQGQCDIQFLSSPKKRQPFKQTDV